MTNFISQTPPCQKTSSVQAIKRSDSILHILHFFLCFSFKSRPSKKSSLYFIYLLRFIFFNIPFKMNFRGGKRTLNCDLKNNPKRNDTTYHLRLLATTGTLYLFTERGSPYNISFTLISYYGDTLSLPGEGVTLTTHHLRLLATTGTLYLFPERGSPYHSSREGDHPAAHLERVSSGREVSFI